MISKFSVYLYNSPIMKLIISLIPIIIIIAIAINVIRFTSKNRRDLKKIKEWGEFNSEKISYVSKISDPVVRSEYVNWCMQTTIGDLDKIKSLNVKELRQELVDRFSEHIPELKTKVKRETRDKRLNEILK